MVLPSWYLQTTYAWDQEYLGHQITKVEHSYTPSRGQYWIVIKQLIDLKNKIPGQYNEKEDDPLRSMPLNLDKCTVDERHYTNFVDRWKNYTDYHNEKIKDKSAKINDVQYLYEVQYVLKTGANWRGPIGNFRLEIKPEHPDDLVIIEGKYPMKRQKDGVCVVELENFTPTKNLRIWMIASNEAWDNRDEQQDTSKPTIWMEFKNWIDKMISL